MVIKGTMTKKTIGIGICILGLCAACTPLSYKYGYNYENVNLDDIIIGKDTMDTVLSKLGTPSTKVAFPVDPQKGGHVWLYLSKKTTVRAFFKPNTVEQHTIAITFDPKNIVQNIRILDGEANVPMNKNETDSSGYETSLIRDIFGNFGRYSAKKSSASSDISRE